MGKKNVLCKQLLLQGVRRLKPEGRKIKKEEASEFPSFPTKQVQTHVLILLLQRSN
jgi:hypothetical protein